jgi:hypothetical protein
VLSKTVDLECLELDCVFVDMTSWLHNVGAVYQ